jgi:hypothetical protein
MRCAKLKSRNDEKCKYEQLEVKSIIKPTCIFLPLALIELAIGFSDARPNVFFKWPARLARFCSGCS